MDDLLSSASEEVPRLSDERLAELVTRYDRLGGELAALERLRHSYEETMREAAKEPSERRAGSLAEYNRLRGEVEATLSLARGEATRTRSREADLERARDEVLEELLCTGMPTGVWFRYGEEAVLLEFEVVSVDQRRSEPLSPRRHVLRLRRALWEVVEAMSSTPEGTMDPREVERRSQELEARRAVGTLRRAAGYLGVAGHLAAPVAAGALSVWTLWGELALPGEDPGVGYAFPWLLAFLMLDVLVFVLTWFALGFLAERLRRLGESPAPHSLPEPL